MTADKEPEFGLGDSHGPGRPGLVLRRHPRTGQRHLDELVWGLLPHDTADPTTAPRPIHARAETVATLPMFADAFQHRRAIVPVDTYFQDATVKGRLGRFAISRVDGKSMAWAGLWEGFRWPNGDVTRSYCVITMEANASLASIHSRMPVVLEELDWSVWLGEEVGDPEALLVPAAEDVLDVRPVRRPKSSQNQAKASEGRRDVLVGRMTAGRDL